MKPKPHRMTQNELDRLHRQTWGQTGTKNMKQLGKQKSKGTGNVSSDMSGVLLHPTQPLTQREIILGIKRNDRIDIIKKHVILSITVLAITVLLSMIGNIIMYKLEPITNRINASHNQDAKPSRYFMTPEDLDQ